MVNEGIAQQPLDCESLMQPLEIRSFTPFMSLSSNRIGPHFAKVKIEAQVLSATPFDNMIP